MLLPLPLGAELAGTQPWKMLCWKGPEAHAWLLLSGGEWGSQDLTTNKMAFFLSFFFETVVWRVFVLYFDGFLAGAPHFLRSRGGSRQSREIEVDTQRQAHFYSFDSSAEHLALSQRPYRLLFGSLHSGHTPHLKRQTVFYLLLHEFIHFWCNWSGWSTFLSKYSGLLLQLFCFLFPQSTKVTQPKWDGHWQCAEGTNHTNESYERTEPNHFLERFICKTCCGLFHLLVYCSCDVNNLGGGGCHLWISTAQSLSPIIPIVNELNCWSDTGLKVGTQ